MWLLVVTISYFISAGVYVADKFILSKKIHSSVAYAFYVGIWSVFNFVILIFAPWYPNLQEFALDIFAGLLFLLTLVFWYKALHQSEATRVVPIVGALTPIFSFMLSFIFLGETLTERHFLAFLILINGGILISVKRTPFYVWSKLKNRFKEVFGHIFGGIHARYHPMRRLVFNSAASALLFAAYYVLMRYIYTTQPFVGSFVWSRLGTFIGAILIFLAPSWREIINKHKQEATRVKSMGFFLLVRLLGSVAFIMLNWAISFPGSSVAVINSLQGVQYVFLILLVLFLSRNYPNIMQEELGGGVLLQKLIGASLILTGFYMLAA